MISEQEYETEKPWGISTCINLYECRHSTITNSRAIKEFTAKLVEHIDMKSWGSCRVVHFGDDPKVTGFSMTQLIETSLISAHFANNTDAAYLDIFSCKWYDQESAANFCKEFFEAKTVTWTAIARP